MTYIDKCFETLENQINILAKESDAKFKFYVVSYYSTLIENEELIKADRMNLIGRFKIITEQVIDEVRNNQIDLKNLTDEINRKEQCLEVLLKDTIKNCYAYKGFIEDEFSDFNSNLSVRVLREGFEKFGLNCDKINKVNPFKKESIVKLIDEASVVMANCYCSEMDRLIKVGVLKEAVYPAMLEFWRPKYLWWYDVYAYAIKIVYGFNDSIFIYNENLENKDLSKIGLEYVRYE